MPWIRARQEIVHRPRRVISSPNGYGDLLGWLKKPRQPEPTPPEPVQPARSLGWLGTQAPPPVVDTTFVHVRRAFIEPPPVPEVKGWAPLPWLGTQVAPPAVDTTFVFVRRPAIETPVAEVVRPPTSLAWLPQIINASLSEQANATDSFGGTTQPGQRFILPWDPQASQRTRHEQQRVRQLLDQDTVEDNLLPDSGVIPGTYTYSTVTVDRKGLVTFAASATGTPLFVKYGAIAATGTTQGDGAAIPADLTNVNGTASGPFNMSLVLPTKGTWMMFIWNSGTVGMKVWAPVGGTLNQFGATSGTQAFISAGSVYYFVSDDTGASWHSNAPVS